MQRSQGSNQLTIDLLDEQLERHILDTRLPKITRIEVVEHLLALVYRGNDALFVTPC